MSNQSFRKNDRRSSQKKFKTQNNNKNNIYNKTSLRVGNIVEVITGTDKGKRGKLLSFDHVTGYVIVEGIAMRTHFFKSKDGGMRIMEGKIHSSNVMLIDSVTDKPTRVRRVRSETNNKVILRIGTKSNEEVL